MVAGVPVVALALSTTGGVPAAAGPPQASYSTSISAAGPNGSSVCYLAVAVTWKAMPGRVTEIILTREVTGYPIAHPTLLASNKDFKAGRTGSTTYYFASMPKSSTFSVSATLYEGRDPNYTTLATTNTVTDTFGGTNECTLPS